MEKREGILVFNEADGKFALAADEQSFPFENIEFGDSFEIKYKNEWIKTSLFISTGSNNQLVFKLKGLENYEGDITGFDARK
ncbi:DUF5348 domain-containing protein [Treponema pectinovorum]|uniref:DUF5348 domain-containing protein n=1 Tax=Treponema pectinovorum TaxID=164 RepID=UPI003D89E0DB